MLILFSIVTVILIILGLNTFLTYHNHPDDHDVKHYIKVLLIKIAIIIVILGGITAAVEIFKL